MRFFSRVVPIREGEAAVAWLMFAYSFLAMTSYNIVRPITRSKFIDTLGADNLPYVDLAAGLAIGLFIEWHGRASRGLARRTIIPATQAGLAALLVLFWLAFLLELPWTPVAFYAFGRLFGLLLISQFWMLANELYDARQARRMFGFIGGGASLGSALGGATTWLASAAVGTTGLLLVSAAALGACMATVRAVTRRHPDMAAADGRDDGRVSTEEALRWLGTSRHLRIIALLVSCAAIGAGIVDQQLNMAADSFMASESAVAEFLGQVTVYLSLAGFLIQVGLTGRIHRHLGLTFALLLLPSGLGLTAVVVLASGALWAPAAARVLDTSLRYTIDKTTRELLFLPLPGAIKVRAKALVDVTVDRLAKALGALLLLVLIKPWGLGLDWVQLSYASLAVMAAWVACARAARREYLRAFRRRLEARDIEPAAVQLDVTDARTIATLVDGLSNPDETAVLYAIEMLDALDRRHLIPPLLLHHDSAQVRIRVLEILEARARAAETDGATPWLRDVERLLRDPDAGVRAAALHTLAAARGEDASALLLACLQDREPRVVVTAAVELADAGRPDAEAAAERALTAIIGAPRAPATARRDVAAALGRIRNPAFRPLLIPLIHDPEIAVAREAITSARAVGPSDALFVPALVSRLGHRMLKAAARETLVSYGDDIVHVLAHVLADRREYRWVRRHIPATLARMPSERSMRVLIAALDDPDGFLRYKAIEALGTLHRHHPELRCDPEPMARLITRETARYCSFLTLRYNLFRQSAEREPSLLVGALDDKLARGLDRIFRLLALLHPADELESARRAIEQGDRRVRAAGLEYLDNVVGGTLRRRVMPLLDDAPLADKVRHANSLIKSRPRDILDTLAQLVHDDDAVVSAAAILYVVDHRLVDALRDDLDYVRTHRASETPVSEAAAWALAGGARTGRPGTSEPLPVVDVARRLRAVPLFGYVSVDELFRVATHARLRSLPAGQDVHPHGPRNGEILFLIEGTARLAGPGEPAAILKAPTALYLEEVLEDRSPRQTPTALEPTVWAALDASEFLAMLSDTASMARGLFRMLVPAPEALDAPGRPPEAVAARTEHARPFDRLDPVETALLLRQIPLLGDATAEELRDLVGVARDVALPAGQRFLCADSPPAVYHVRDGELSIEVDGMPRSPVGPGGTIGLAETLTGASFGRQAAVTREGRALRIDAADLFDVLADRDDLLRKALAGALRTRAGEPVREPFS